jgi:hypothetical protein
VSADDIEMDPDIFKAIRDWPTPQSVDELHWYLGFSSTGDSSKTMPKWPNPWTIYHGYTNKSGKKSKDKPPWHWGEVEQASFGTLNDLLCSPPVLGFADYTLYRMNFILMRHVMDLVPYCTKIGVNLYIMQVVVYLLQNVTTHLIRSESAPVWHYSKLVYSTRICAFSTCSIWKDQEPGTWYASVVLLGLRFIGTMHYA